MNLRGRLLLYVLLIAAVTTAAFQITRRIQPPPPSRAAIGLDWLQHEYHIRDDAFGRIVKMHREYFARCEAMCAEMIEARNPSRARSRLLTQQAALGTNPPPVASHEQQKVICVRCLETMISHLHAVAGEMDPEQGRRFLADILPEVTNPRELRELNRARAVP